VRPIFVDEVARFNAVLREHHWLGHRLTGQVLRYVAVLDGEWVAVVGFGSAVLSCRARDEFLGWSREQQYARLKHVANNQRFCVLPAGRRWQSPETVETSFSPKFPDLGGYVPGLTCADGV